MGYNKISAPFEPKGSYFGIVVTDGLDWHQCYSWAWEIKQYFNGIGVFESFKDVNWEEDLTGIMHQCIAITLGFAEMPDKRFVIGVIDTEAS